jgi:hypothetical protein
MKATADPAKLTAPEAEARVPSDFSLVLGGPLFEVIPKMRPFPFGKEALIRLVVTVALPFLPLLLTMLSLEELLAKLVKVLL